MKQRDFGGRTIVFPSGSRNLGPNQGAVPRLFFSKMLVRRRRVRKTVAFTTAHPVPTRSTEMRFRMS